MKLDTLIGLLLLRGTIAVPASKVTTAAEDAQYTSSMLEKLWSGMDVATGTVTSVVKPTDLTAEEVAPPPNMPTWNSKYRLPSDFMYGFAGAAFQIEGAVKADGRGPCIYDTLAHRSNGTIESADIAANHYYLYKQDAKRLKALGIPNYSLTISWTRLFPFGNGTLNKAGLQHYIDEVDYLLGEGIEPMVTLFHFDTPQFLQNAYGGWLNEKIVDDFMNYAKVVFDALGSKVKTWITVNEPDMYCKLGTSSFPEDVYPTHGVDKRAQPWICGHNMLMAHAKAAEYFNKHVKSKYKDRKISYKDAMFVSVPYSDSKDDAEATERSLEFCKWFAKPIFVDGDYPDLMKQELGDLLPTIKDEDKKLIKGSADFFGWDGYYQYVSKAPDGGLDACIKNNSDPLWPSCSNNTVYNSNGWRTGGGSGEGPITFYSTPDIFRKALNWIWKQFKPADGIVVSEYGHPVGSEVNNTDVYDIRYDEDRVDYFVAYMNKMLEAVNEDGVKVSGAFSWAATDTYEWANAYKLRFGLQYVDFETLERQYKKSAFVVADFFKHHVGQGHGHQDYRT